MVKRRNRDCSSEGSQADKFIRWTGAYTRKAEQTRHGGHRLTTKDASGPNVASSATMRASPESQLAPAMNIASFPLICCD